MPTSLSKSPTGVTLIEILVSVALGVFIISTVSLVSFDYLNSYQYQKEEETLVAILQKTRSRSINNVNGVPHALRIETSLPHTYTILPENESYNYSDNLVVNGGSPITVAFEQLTGNTTPVQISVNDGKRNNIIDINSEGRIDW